MSRSPLKNGDITILLTRQAEEVNDLLKRLLDEQVDIQPVLRKAMRYTLEAPGKRIRAVLALWCCELVSGQVNDIARIAAAAIEMVHTYSLIHDDLPAMDDDDLRRGRPTCHKAFDEATAILAGDALLTLAFQILAEKVKEPGTAIRLIRTLATAAGPAGMIAGQVDDMAAEKKQGTLNKLRQIHLNKTAKMFSAAAAMGAIAGGAEDAPLEALLHYGLNIGLGFQIADDILDVSATSEHLGKTVGKDDEAGKLTYPSLVGLDRSRQMSEKITEEAISVLVPFGPQADRLRGLAEMLLSRTR
ncbi:MAG: polyprenyl synthetase family protein [Sedimentisphaerales bacterium]|nr:polyprenyl synthetase family protein [Sedimentisphaerales bacterium]